MLCSRSSSTAELWTGYGPHLLLLLTSLSLMVSESSACPCLAWSCSCRAWSCSSRSCTSLSATARSALASVSSERRSTSWAWRGEKNEWRERGVDDGLCLFSSTQYNWESMLDSSCLQLMCNRGNIFDSLSPLYFWTNVIYTDYGLFAFLFKLRFFLIIIVLQCTKRRSSCVYFKPHECFSIEKGGFNIRVKNKPNILGFRGLRVSYYYRMLAECSHFRPAPSLGSGSRPPHHAFWVFVISQCSVIPLSSPVAQQHFLWFPSPVSPSGCFL